MMPQPPFPEENQCFYLTNEYHDFSAEIEVAIINSSYVVIIVTPSVEANPSSFVRREIMYAQAKNKPIIPLVFPRSTVPIPIIHLSWISFHNNNIHNPALLYEEGLAELLERLQEVPQPIPPQNSEDIFREYLISLYDGVVSYLDKTVFSLISLSSKPINRPVNSSQQAFPQEFWDTALTKDEESEDDFNDLTVAFARYEGRVLVLGQPGAGKTITLMAFARNAIVKRLEDISQPLPLIAPIATWSYETQPTLFQWFENVSPMLKELPLVQEIIKGKTLLILDGLDELSDRVEDPVDKQFYNPRTQFLEILPSNNQLIISCRSKGVDEIAEKIPVYGAVNLQPLNDIQIKNFLNGFPGLWEILEADNQLREISRTPLLLSLFTYAFEGLNSDLKSLRNLNEGKLSEKIFETYIYRRYTHETRKRNKDWNIPLEVLIELLGCLAVEDAFRAGEINLLEQGDFRIIEDRVELKQFIEFAEQLHILVYSEGNIIRFIHNHLFNYFAYNYAVKHLNDPDYRVKAKVAKALGKTGDKRAIKYLLDMLLDKSEKSVLAVNCAIDSLGELNNPDAVPNLIKALDDLESTVLRINIAHILGTIGDTRAVIPLIQLLDEASDDLKNVAVRSLGVIGDPRAVKPLIKKLFSDKDIAATVAQALENGMCQGIATTPV